MVFSSLLFLYAFLPLSLACYALCRGQKARNISLLLFSLVFYAWGEPKYVLLLIFMSFADWFCALRISALEDRADKKAWLGAAVIIDLSLIGFFKYAGLLCSVFGPVPAVIENIALPIGISFYTFQLLTYVIDVYRGEAQAQRSFWRVLLYASLFHQCVAGPIVRYQSIAGELYGERSSRGELLPGIRRFAAALAKKTLLANPCGALADALLTGDLERLKSLTVLGAWLGAAAFMLQIYLDFSAYSDMAIGMGKMLGLHYPENFNYPYVSRSVTEFWRRWHMSLSSFFRDYVYIPLGGNRCSRARNLLNLFIVWALTGLWHGASWNFVLWGLYFFVFLMLEKLFLRRLLERTRLLSHVYLLLIALVGWILFYFTDLKLGWAVFTDLFALNGNRPSDFITVTVLQNNLFLLIASCLCCTPLFKRLGERLDARFAARGGAPAAAWEIIRSCVVPIALLLLATSSLVGDSYNPFIYFQF